MSAVADRCRSSYLGYPLEITDRDVTVYDQHDRKLVTVTSIGAARLFIRGYRRVPANTETRRSPSPCR
jgi:hypothetical protein